MLTFSCKKGGNPQAAEEYYTCPMHASVRSDKPGACPVCGMGLVKVKKKSGIPEASDSTMLTLDNEKQMLANIKVDIVQFTDINNQITLTGKISVDENKMTTIAAKVKGRPPNSEFLGPRGRRTAHASERCGRVCGARCGGRRHARRVRPASPRSRRFGSL